MIRVFDVVHGCLQMSSEASRLAVSIGGVEERVSSEAKLVQQERANLEKHKRRVQAGKVHVRWDRMGCVGVTCCPAGHVSCACAPLAVWCDISVG